MNFTDMEVSVAGCTFLVTGNVDTYGTEIDKVSIKGQPEADADSLLVAIKVEVGGEVLGGHDLLEDKIYNDYTRSL